ncbi:MAG: hypothetical protein L3J47_04925 [Sulfurovum sp.]|nr:hypothetical protein [Sulfurovum sp.]
MWNIYFGEWKEGRLKRLAYLGYDVLLMVIGMAVLFGTVMLAGGVQEAFAIPSASIVESMGIMAILFFFLFFMALLVANLNIMAKRIRDMGLPAWGTVVAIILISIVLEALFPAQQTQMSVAVADVQGQMPTAAVDTQMSQGSLVSNIFNLIVFACLVFIPSDAFNKNKSESQEG